MSDQVPVPPSISCTCWEERGRDGGSSVLASAHGCKATCSTVFIRSGSDSRSFHGACSEKYLLASETVRIASVIANLNRDRDQWAPTVVKAAREFSSSAWSTSVSWVAAGISPTLRAANDTARLTRLPQVATSSSLLRRTNSLQVKSVSWFSGPAIAT